jgi:hypothetical protein
VSRVTYTLLFNPELPEITRPEGHLFHTAGALHATCHMGAVALSWHEFRLFRAAGHDSKYEQVRAENASSYVLFKYLQQCEYIYVNSET